MSDEKELETAEEITPEPEETEEELSDNELEDVSGGAKFMH